MGLACCNFLDLLHRASVPQCQLSPQPFFTLSICIIHISKYAIRGTCMPLGHFSGVSWAYISHNCYSSSTHLALPMLWPSHSPEASRSMQSHYLHNNHNSACCSTRWRSSSQNAACQHQLDVPATLHNSSNRTAAVSAPTLCHVAFANASVLQPTLASGCEP